MAQRRTPIATMSNGMMRDSGFTVEEIMLYWDEVHKNMVLIEDDAGYKEIHTFHEGFPIFVGLRKKGTRPRVTKLSSKASKVLFGKK